jgi:hypothetical protein
MPVICRELLVLSAEATPMKILLRRALLFLFAIVSLCGGGYLFFLCTEHPSIYGMLRGGGMATIFVGLGGYLLWDDFIKPRIS